ncbi:hypothetical protein ccbrp13_41460 [Ktedonobacteria bacterium brp13]|nr:hypothetical protein ccbrp13_41460 [Ktedonobacteria bacterium brp13]
MFLFYVGLIQLIKPAPLLVVDNVGFHKRTRSGKDQFIAWDEIALIFSSRERNHFILNVCVSEAGMETLSIRYPKPERILPLVDSKMAIDFSLSNVSEQKLIDSIKNKYQRQIKQNNILVYLFKSA